MAPRKQHGSRHPLALWLLVAALLFLATGGIYGGAAMLIDPTGGLLQLEEILPMLPIPDFRLPGLFLLFVMGLTPVFLAYGLLWQPSWRWMAHLSGWSGHHWAWTGTLALTAILSVWLLLQGLLIGFRWPIQYVTAANGLLIALLGLTPRVARLYVAKVQPV